MGYIFGDYALDTERYELRHLGLSCPVGPKAFALLIYLLEQRDRVVTKAELLEQLWSNQYIGESALTSCMLVVRKALGEHGRKRAAQRYIKTVHGRGYRFIAPVQEGGVEVAHVASAVSLDTASAVNGQAAQPMPSTSLSATSFGHRAEQRPLTFLACQLMGASDGSARLDTESLLEVVRHYQDMCTAIVRQCSGYMAQYQSDRLMAYFGYPQTHADEVRHAVYAGLKIRAGAAELARRSRCDTGGRLAVRVGIHTGMVVVGTPGPYERGRMILGHSPTVAGRLYELTAPDTVVISATTWRLVKGQVVCESLGTHVLAELSEPLEVYRVLQESAA